MSTKAKTAPDGQGMAPASEARNATASEAWNAVYGEAAAPPLIKYPVPFGGLPAAEAMQLAEKAGRAGLPESMAFVCEVTVPREPGALPQLTLAVPWRLQEPLRHLAKMAGTPRQGTDAGLGLLLGCCGQIQYAVMQEAPPSAPSPIEGRLPGPDLDQAITATLGLLRLAERGGDDPSWCFERNSPVWFLFIQNALALEAAWNDYQTRGRGDRTGRPGLALSVLETGSVPEQGKAVAE